MSTLQGRVVKKGEVGRGKGGDINVYLFLVFFFFSIFFFLKTQTKENLPSRVHRLALEQQLSFFCAFFFVKNLCILEWGGWVCFGWVLSSSVLGICVMFQV